MNVLITGVAGLLGSRLADWIVKNKNIRVIGIDDLSGGYEENINSNVIFYKRNIAEHDISDIFKKHKPDLVYHMAAYAAEGLSPFIRKFNYKNNVLATANVINNCIEHTVTRLIFTSSMAVYGYGNNEPPFSEDLQPQPIDPYGIAKYACELDIKVAGEQHDLDWCIIRPHNVYGEKQNLWDRYRNVLGIWMYQKINNNPMTIFGDGNQKRAFSYVDDCLLPLWNAGTKSEANNEIINLGGIREYTINDACEILRSVVGGSDVVKLEKRHEVKYAYPTYQKSIDILDYQETTSLRDGLEKMWKWSLTQPNRKRFTWKNYEIDKGIYDYWKK